MKDGQTVVLSPGTTGSTTYYEAGNISVQAGGTLDIIGLTVDWVQFIGNTGTVAQRLGNVFWFSDAGTVTMTRSTITTDPYVLNAFVKLNVSVTGTMVVGQQSSFEFPGWVTVSGSGSLFFNNSVSTGNPDVGAQIISSTLLEDESFSPSLEAETGGQIFIGDSTVENYYADNYGSFGVPGADVIANSTGEVTAPYSWSGFELAPPVAAGIAQAYAWEKAPIVQGVLQIGYTENTPTGYSGGGTYTFSGTGYTLPTLAFGYAPAGAILDVPLSGSGAVGAINTAGVAAFLQDTGSFGTASAMSLAFNFGTSAVNVTSLSIILYPQLQYNITASGAGSKITAADSTLGINFAAVPGTPVASGTPPPAPWDSNKLLISGGANAYLGNVSVVGAAFAPFNDSSAVIPSGTSEAFFYQWLAVPITGGRNAVPVANGTTTAVYAGSNATLAAQVASLNDLATTDPALATYVTDELASRGLTPGVSAGQGFAWSMLVSTALTSTLLPTGQFIGAYNVTVTVPPGGAGEVTTVAASLTPYPTLVSPGAPFTSPPAAFPNYEAILGLPHTVPLVASVENYTVAIGQELQFDISVMNTGTAPTNNYTVDVIYPETTKDVTVATTGLVTSSIASGENITVPLSWVVNESVTGMQDKTHFLVDFLVEVVWNGGVPDGGVNQTAVPVTITPAFISITWTPPTGKLPTNTQTIDSTGTATYAGKGTGSLTVLATGKGGTFTLESIAITNGTLFETDLSAVAGMAKGSAYAITLVAVYNGRTYTYNPGVSLTVAGTPTQPNLLTEKFFGLPLWIWLVIAAGIVAAVLGVMFGLGRFARGRLVECGECGNLIPEDATVCPKCGAEFESDLVRCSRCGSTIPASSAVCPECAATLLARAGPENADPERQSYADFVERFRTEAKKELGQNYSEGAFWDWWKRQPTYVAFSQWRLQQAQGTRTGMTAPVVTEEAETPAAAPPKRPPSAGAPPAASAGAPAARPAAPRSASAPRAAAPAAAPAAAATVPSPASAAAAPAAAATPGMKNCPNCGKQINSDFLVCPFCGSVTG